MADTLAVVLNVKGFFENPSLLLGIPLVALGVLGVLLILAPIELRWPQRTVIERGEILPHPGGHPTVRTYVSIGVVLAIVTAVELAFYYIEVPQGALLFALLVLSLMKFVLVVLWFMHLQLDSPMFSALFTGGMVLTVALFFVVLATLGANLV